MKALKARGRAKEGAMMICGSLVFASLLLHAEVIGVSPGAGERFVRVGTQCPTFSWTNEAGAAYELEVYRVEERGPRTGEPIWRQALPAGATSWTPAEEKCLAAGGRYAWAVRAVDARSGEAVSPWSRANLFEVRGSAIEGATPSGAVGLTVEGDDPDGAAAAFISDVGGRLISGQALGDEVYSLDAQGNVVANSFTGDGSAISQVLAAGQNCPPGTLLRGLGPDGALICALGSLRSSVVDDDPVNSVGRGSSIAIGLDGNPVISYYDQTDNDLRVVKCDDPACSGMDETISIVDATNNAGSESAILVPIDGNPIIAYSFRDGLNFGTLRVAKCNDPACTGSDEDIYTVSELPDIVGGDVSMDIGNDGHPVISHWNSTADTLLVTKCNDANCAGEDEMTYTVDDPVSGNEVGSHTSIAVGMNGNPVISYYDSTAGALKVAACNDPDCAGEDEIITTMDDPANAVGTSTSIAIGLDGNPVISYSDDDDGNLKVAKCNVPQCNDMLHIVSVVDDDPVNFVAQSTSLAIGPDGNPVISHYDFQADALKVAKCNDPACTGMNELNTFVDDPANDVGRDSSIAIGHDGNPVISYWEFTAAALKVTKCANPACTP